MAIERMPPVPSTTVARLTVLIGTDFGPGSMTTSGYARIAKRWKRGTPLADAKTVFEGRSENIWVGVSVDTTPGFERTLIVRALDFYRQEHFLLQGDTLVRLDVPDDARVTFMHSAGVAGDTLLLQAPSASVRDALPKEVSLTWGNLSFDSATNSTLLTDVKLTPKDMPQIGLGIQELRLFDFDADFAKARLTGQRLAETAPLASRIDAKGRVVVVK